MEFEKGDLFIFDREGSIVQHRKPELVGQSITNLRDMKGRAIYKVMRDDTLEASGDGAVFQWKNDGEIDQRKKK